MLFLTDLKLLSIQIFFVYQCYAQLCNTENKENHTYF